VGERISEKAAILWARALHFRASAKAMLAHFSVKPISDGWEAGR
jgi:hypothetical protein